VQPSITHRSYFRRYRFFTQPRNSRILWISEIQSHVHKTLQLDSILCQTNPLQAKFFKVIPSSARSSKRTLSGFPPELCIHFSLPHTCHSSRHNNNNSNNNNNNNKVKGRGGSITCNKGTEGEGEQRYSSALSLISVLDGNGRSRPRPGRFTPRKEAWYPLYRRLGGPHSRS
jgi:hypothetical protein